MDYGVKSVTYDIKCTCGTEFKYTSCGTGPVETCERGYLDMLELVYGCEIPGRDKFGCIVLNHTKPVGHGAIG